jgi:PKD repeat protein
MYTQGQVDRMRAALQVSSTGRFNLWQAANLTATGATNDFYLCKAQFTTERTTICLGDSIQLFDDSYNAVTAWNWEITPATGWNFGAGSSVTSQNPKINFSAPGLYSVKLTATDGSTTDDEVKSNYIRVLPDAAVLPYWEGFEYYTTLANNNYWEVSNQNNNNTWTIESTTAHSGLKCARITNFGQAAGSIDELTSAPIDLSVIPSTGSVTLSFRYAYRKKTAADYEYLKVFASSDCGESWAQRKTLGGNSLSSLTSSTSWKPSQQSDWVTVHMTNITSSYFTPNFKMRFRFEGEGGNNIYLDDINMYSGAPSDNLVLGVNEIAELKDIELFPNPTEGDIHLRYFSEIDSKLNISITDISGKEVNKTDVMSKSGNNLVVLPTEGLSSGTYLIKVGNSSQTLKFVVK